LAVDDNEIKAYTLRRTLESAGFPADIVSSGEAAVQAAFTGRFAAVLLDIHMPGMSGFDVCARIRANRSLPQPTIIFHSATDPNESTIERGIAAGADAFLAHPIDRHALVAVLLHLARNRANPSANLLGSWKEIANYFGKGVRTVQRWERQYNMPVFRPNGTGSFTVFADPDQLRDWAVRHVAEVKEYRG
jgi:CheY-like chemotaxis protein